VPHRTGLILSLIDPPDSEIFHISKSSLKLLLIENGVTQHSLTGHKLFSLMEGSINLTALGITSQESSSIGEGPQIILKT
jgi:hypothetical protein|tara:strand:- start:245 stop:484 length:240 start_codon:yes stop_codon:yes gene_type:complete